MPRKCSNNVYNWNEHKPYKLVNDNICTVTDDGGHAITKQRYENLATIKRVYHIYIDEVKVTVNNRLLLVHVDIALLVNSQKL